MNSLPRFMQDRFDSYVSLCRELKLPREWQTGDAFVEYDPTLRMRIEDHGWVFGTCSANVWPVTHTRTGELAWWLPTVADWLEMLEAAGEDSVAFRATWHQPGWLVGIGPNGDGDLFPSGEGVTREEALARLFVKVTAK